METAAQNNCIVVIYLQRGSNKILAIGDLRPSNKHQTGSSTNRKHVSANA